MNKRKSLGYQMRYVCMMLACLLMVGCQEEELVPDYGEGVGYLRLKLGKVDVELSSTTKAEAGELPDTLIPATADFMVDVKMGKNSVEGFPKKYSDIEADGIPLNAGTYTVIAYHGENELIQTEPYFEGSASVEIFPGEEDEAKITASLANAMLEPAVSESLQKHYSDWKLTAKVGDASLKLADNESSDGCLFAKAGQEVKAVFEGTNLVGKESTHEWTVISSAVAQTKYVIQCDPDLSVFENIKITATAKHTYNEEGSLTGTDVTLNLAANGAPLELISGWSITLRYNRGNIRTFSAQPENGSLMTVEDGWPYVPQGSTLSATLFLQTGDPIYPEVVLEAIPQPEFTATVSGNTSYSVYLDSGADVANTKDGSSIFDITATTNIASEILNNPNYSNLLKVTYTTDSGQNSGELPYGTSTQFNSLAWQKHALSATVSFDGVEKTSAAVDCHVTGLPYRAEPPKSIDSEPLYGWTKGSGNVFNWESDYLQLGVSAGQGEHTVYKNYYIPADINVNVSAKIAAHNAPINTTCSILMGEETVMSVYSDGGVFNYNTNTIESTVAKTMTTSSNVITLKNSYSMTSSWGRIYYVNILYR